MEKKEFDKYELREKKSLEIIAKNFTKKELEEHYINSFNEEPRKLVSWGSLTLVIILGLLLLVMFVGVRSYPNSEFDNYRDIGKYLCENNEYNGYRYFIFENDDKLIFECSSDRIIINLK